MNYIDHATSHISTPILFSTATSLYPENIENLIIHIKKGKLYRHIYYSACWKTHRRELVFLDF